MNVVIFYQPLLSLQAFSNGPQGEQRFMRSPFVSPLPNVQFVELPKQGLDHTQNQVN